MKIEVNITKIHFYVLAVAIAVFGIALFAVAYNEAFTGGVPETFGHSADELNVKVGDNVMTLQAAIDAGAIGGFSDIKVAKFECTDDIGSASCSLSEGDPDITNEDLDDRLIMECPDGYMAISGGVSCWCENCASGDRRPVVNTNRPRINFAEPEIRKWIVACGIRDERIDLAYVAQGDIVCGKTNVPISFS